MSLNLHLIRISNDPLVSKILFLTLPVLIALGLALLTGNAVHALPPGTCGGGCGS